MKFVLAPDSFKESMTALEATLAMREGVLAVFPDAEVLGVPMADGGEGTVEAIAHALGGDIWRREVQDPLGRQVGGTYAYAEDSTTAVIEVAAAAGLHLVDPEDRDILRASSFGVGQLISAALDDGATDVVIGLGGSATNDGGAGMLTALGVRFSDADGKALEPGGAALQNLAHIDVAGLDPRLRDVRIRLACDVTAPLLGPDGASAVFGPQKGATPEDVERLDLALARLAQVTGETLAGADPERPGSGAAGGLGFAFMAYLGATGEPGVELVAETVDLATHVVGADWVFTGEGGVDAQTLLGKTPFGVTEVARAAGARVAIFAGKVAPDSSVLLDHGVDRIVAITPDGTPRGVALTQAREFLTRATVDVCRAIS